MMRQHTGPPTMQTMKKTDTALIDQANYLVEFKYL